VRQLLTGPRRW